MELEDALISLELKVELRTEVRIRDLSTSIWPLQSWEWVSHRQKL